MHSHGTKILLLSKAHRRSNYQTKIHLVLCINWLGEGSKFAKEILHHDISLLRHGVFYWCTYPELVTKGNMIFIISTALFGTFVLTWVVIKVLSQRLLDMPTHRSSHVLPTPRGGGIAIATTTVLIFTFITFCTSHPLPSFTFAMLLAAMAGLGALDDFFNLNIYPRLFTQAILSLVGIYFCVENLELTIFERILIGLVLTLGLLWFINLYNFMDGINGLAVIQAICTCATMGIIFHATGKHTEAINFLLILASACAGFIYWNFPKAKIFMGDTGSLLLGFAIGFIAIKTSIGSLEIGAAWLIMLAIFISDSTYTLGVRTLSGQKFYLPHRSHSYQKLAAILKSHTKVTLAVAVTNILWLFPLALLCIYKTINPAIALIIAYTPFLVLAIKLKAGHVG